MLGCVAGAGLELELCAGADELELAGALLDEDSAGALFLSSVRLSLLLLYNAIVNYWNIIGLKTLKLNK